MATLVSAEQSASVDRWVVSVPVVSHPRVASVVRSVAVEWNASVGQAASVPHASAEH